MIVLTVFLAALFGGLVGGFVVAVLRARPARMTPREAGFALRLIGALEGRQLAPEEIDPEVIESLKGKLGVIVGSELPQREASGSEPS